MAVTSPPGRRHQNKHIQIPLLSSARYLTTPTPTPPSNTSCSHLSIETEAESISRINLTMSSGNDTKLPVAESSRPDRDSARSKRQKRPASTAPTLGRWILATITCIVLSAIVLILASGTELGNLTLNDLEKIDASWEVCGLVVWKMAEMELAWRMGFDARDMASFYAISHLPIFSLLSSFYAVRPTTMLLWYTSSVVCPSLPIIFMRSFTSVHNRSRALPGIVPNRSILQDRLTSIYTTLVPSAVFSLVLYISYRTWLPAYLVVHFEGIPSITAVHAGPATLPTLFATFLLPGWLVRDFLFVSSTGAPADTKPQPSAGRQGEYLITTVYRRTWGVLSTKTKVLVKRTVLLAVAAAADSAIQIPVTVKGADYDGAAGWGAVWSFAILIIGLTYGWIEGVEGV